MKTHRKSLINYLPSTVKMALKFQVCVCPNNIYFANYICSVLNFIGIASMFISNYHYLFLLFDFPLIELKFPGDLIHILLNSIHFHLRIF